MLLLALRNVRRGWRGGELALLALSLVLAVAIVSGIAGFSQRLQSAMAEQSQHFLAAQRVLKSPRPVPDAWLSTAAQFGLVQAELVSFRSMVMAGDSMQLAAIKAASSAYPLLGELETSERIFSPGQAAAKGPGPGEIWLDSRLFALLDIQPGDHIAVGEVTLVASRVLVSQPDQGAVNNLFAPGALMNLADLAASEVVQPGSRVSYRYLFNGDDTNLDAFREALAGQLQAGHQWLDLADGQPALATTLARAETYLLLAASLGVALAGVAVALAARRYGERHLDQVAVMKVMGASRRYILQLFSLELVLVALAATVIGGALGFAVQHSLVSALASLVPSSLPDTDGRPLLVGGLTALLCTGVFALPPIWRLSRVSPMRMLRRDPDAGGNHNLLAGAVGLLGVAGMMWWYSGDPLLAGALLGGSLSLILLAAVAVLQVLALAKRLAREGTNSRLRLVLAAVYRRRHANAFQVACFALALMALATLALLRESLVDDWQVQLQEGAPNHFLINIQRAELAPLQAFFDRHHISHAGLYPMVRGRLSHIGGRTLAEIPEVDASEGNIDREMNLSWADQLPGGNVLVAGRWWADEDRNAQMLPVSVEQDLAEQLHLDLGSALTFDLGGQQLPARVTSIRQLDWASMRPNFYFIFPPESLGDYAGSYITSFYLDGQRKVLLSELLRAFPTFTLIEIDTVLAQMKVMVAQLSAAVAVILVMVLLCALLVTIANVQSSLDSRLRENALLRTLGAGSGLIRSSLLAEFLVMGALAGLLAALGANLILFAVQKWGLEMAPQWHGSGMLLAPLAGGLSFALIGWLGCRRVINRSPLPVLRQAQA